MSAGSDGAWDVFRAARPIDPHADDVSGGEPGAAWRQAGLGAVQVDLPAFERIGGARARSEALQPGEELVEPRAAPSRPMVHCESVMESALTIMRQGLWAMTLQRVSYRLSAIAIRIWSGYNSTWPQSLRLRPRRAPILPLELVAPAVHAHFVHHIQAAAQQGYKCVASIPIRAPSKRSSTRRSGRACGAKKATFRRSRWRCCRPTKSPHPLLFERPLPLDAGALAKVAPAVERAGIHLGVWRARDGELRGVGHDPHDSRAACLVVEVAAPGLLVVKHHRGEESGKFVNVAVLEGDQVKIVDERASSLPDCPALLTSLLGFDSPASWAGDSVNVLVQLAVSMRAHGRGGALLVVPAASDAWRDSIVQPIPYAVVAAVRRAGGLMRETTAEPGRERAWQDASAAPSTRSPD